MYREGQNYERNEKERESNKEKKIEKSEDRKRTIRTNKHKVNRRVRKK